MTGRLSKCGKNPSRAPGPPSLSPHCSPLHPLQPALVGAAPTPGCPGVPVCLRSPDTHTGPRLPPRRPAVPSPQSLPPATSLIQSPERPQARPKIKAGQDSKAQSRKGRLGPEASKAPSCGLWPKVRGPPGPGLQARVRPSAVGGGRAGHLAVASSEQRWGSCLFLPGRRPGLGGGAEVPWGQEHRLGPHGCPFLFPRDGLSGTPTLAACPSPHHTQAPCLSTDPSVCLSAADLCVHAVPPGLAGGGAPGLPGGV